MGNSICKKISQSVDKTFNMFFCTRLIKQEMQKFSKFAFNLLRNYFSFTFHPNILGEMTFKTIFYNHKKLTICLSFSVTHLNVKVV